MHARDFVDAKHPALRAAIARSLDNEEPCRRGRDGDALCRRRQTEEPFEANADLQLAADVHDPGQFNAGAMWHTVHLPR